MMGNLSQSASHSSMLWLVKMIEVPDLRKHNFQMLNQKVEKHWDQRKLLLRNFQLEINLLMALMVSHILRLAAGSTPVVGSSKSITFSLGKSNHAACRHLYFVCTSAFYVLFINLLHSYTFSMLRYLALCRNNQRIIDFNTGWIYDERWPYTASSWDALGWTSPSTSRFPSALKMSLRLPAYNPKHSSSRQCSTYTVVL